MSLPLRPPGSLPRGSSTCHRGHGMLSCVGEEGTVRMTISNFLTSKASQPRPLGKLPDWGLSPLLLPQTQNFSPEGPKFPYPF